MKLPLSVFRSVCLSVMLLCTSWLTALHGQSIKIKHLAVSPHVDGSYDPIWDSANYQPLATLNYGTVSSTADLSGRFKVAWTADTLFLFAMVRDNEWRNDNQSDRSLDDGIEIYLDVNNDKPGSYQSDDFYYLIRYNDATVYEIAHGTTNGVTMAQSQSGDTVCYEIAIPFSTLTLSSVVDKLPIGFDVQITDNDGGTRQGKLGWFSEYNLARTRPSYFGVAFFSGEQGELQAYKPDFSSKRGIYKEAFNLTLSSIHSGATIWYTLDGSNPLFSGTRVEATAPATVFINPASTLNRGGRTPGVVIRAAVEAPGYSMSKVATQSYIFIDAVSEQDAPGGMWRAPRATFDWPGYTAPQSIAYLMNQEITQSSTYADLMDDALLEIPTYSLVFEYNDLFDASSGIYMNALKEGWERPVSVELIDPNGADFQCDAAIRMRGRYSRLPRNPKHSFRILFKDDYGPAKLDYPVFGGDGLNQYDHLDFRTAQNSSWQSGEDPSTVTFLKEIYARDVQGEMGHDHTRSYYCHLYLNGVYWGLYQIQERADEKFAQEYMGYSAQDYDVIKPQKNVIDPPNDLLIGASGGNLDAAQRLWNAMISGFSSNADYFRIQGMNADGTPNATYEKLLDVENLIDYLLISFYTGSEDGPGVIWPGLWGEMVRPNNFIGIYNRTNPDGFKWLVHDMEKSMYYSSDNTYINGLDASWYSQQFSAFNPLTIHRALLSNNEYRLKFSDRVYKFFSEGGLFTPETVAAMLEKRKEQIYNPVIAEAARWSWWVTSGSDLSNVPTRADWEQNVNHLLEDYVPLRTDYVVQLFSEWGYAPTLEAPQILEKGMPIEKKSITVDPGTPLLFTHTNSNGTIYYVTDGSDPRAVGGAVKSSAISVSNNGLITMNHGMDIKARVKNGNEWSPLYELGVDVLKEIPGLAITEIHYNPSVDSTGRSSDLEFIELKNTGSNSIDLSACSFTKGIDYTFPETHLQPGNFFVIASDADTFQLRYGFAPNAFYLGNLKNSGEQLVLKDREGSIAMKLDYSDGANWPMLADGYGYSLVPATQNVATDPDKSEYWRSSTNMHGSPGVDDPELTLAPIEITEVLSYAELPILNQVELYNPTSSAADIGGWFLSDDRKQPKKWQIPAGTTISAGGYRLFSSNDFDAGFHVDPDGEELCLTSATEAGLLTGYSSKVNFGAAMPSVSFGKHTNSQGEDFFVAQENNSLGTGNTLPAVGPVVISQIMYHPADSAGEYLQLKNISSETVSFSHPDEPQYTWKVEGADFKFPQEISLASGDSLYIIEAQVSDTAFRRMYHLETGIQVFSMEGSLSNGGETIGLYRPGIINDPNKIERPPYVLVDAVSYSDKAPWNPVADGYGYTLVRVADNEFGNDPANWKAVMVRTYSELKETHLPDALAVYPNPTSGMLWIELPSEAVAHITVRDIYGRVVSDWVIEGSHGSVDVSGLKSGMYILSIEQDNQYITQRIVKQ